MLRKLVVLSLMLIISAGLANAQDFKKFRLGLGLGYAAASGEGAKGGILVDLEPGYRITDQILVNLRLESAALVRGSTEDLGSDVDLDVAAIGSYTLNGQYYLSNNNFRPFVGFGFGLFSMAAVSIEDTSSGSTGDISESANEFGVYPRIGFDAGHFTLNIDYNILPNTKGAFGTEFKNSYIGFRIGGYFFGGRN